VESRTDPVHTRGRSRLLDQLETRAIPVVLVLIFSATAAVALELAHDPAGPIIGLAALAVSFYNLWRAEWRQAQITALLVDDPKVRAAGSSDAVRFQVSQLLVVENVGGRPCVLAGVEVSDPWVTGGIGLVAEVKLYDVVVPRVLNPRDPVIARLVFDRIAEDTARDGQPSTSWR
jgi:hypothetical protein